MSQSSEDRRPDTTEEEDLRPEEEHPPRPVYRKKRSSGQKILDALRVSSQVAPSTSGEVALLNRVNYSKGLSDRIASQEAER